MISCRVSKHPRELRAKGPPIVMHYAILAGRSSGSLPGLMPGNSSLERRNHISRHLLSSIEGRSMRSSPRQRIVRGRFAPVIHGHAGSALIEFSLVALVFFGIMFAIFDLGRLFYIQFALHSAVREASRFTVTGNVLPDPNNPGQFLSRVDSIVSTLQRAVPGLGVQPGNVTVQGPDGAGDAGRPGDVVTISIDYDIEMVTPFIRPLFPDGVHHYSVSLVSQNEPFNT